MTFDFGKARLVCGFCTRREDVLFRDLEGSGGVGIILVRAIVGHSVVLQCWVARWLRWVSGRKENAVAVKTRTEVVPPKLRVTQGQSCGLGWYRSCDVERRSHVSRNGARYTEIVAGRGLDRDGELKSWTAVGHSLRI